MLIALSLIVASCGDSDVPDGRSEQPGVTDRTQVTEVAALARPVAVVVPERLVVGVDPQRAGAAITAFATDLFAGARNDQPGHNVTVSPTSVAFALAMLEPGTVGDAQTQMRTLLHIDDPVAFHASMNALQQNLQSRVPQDFGPDVDPGEITMHVADAAYLQRGYPFEPTYLQAIGSNYGPVLYEVDFSADPDAVAHAINQFVAEATNDRITDLIGDGVIKPETVLALVNALYMKASWLQTFDAATTTEHPFTDLDGTQISVPLMNGSGSTSASGDGWIGATKDYVGGVSAQFILPDEGRFDEVAGNLGSVLAEYETNRTSGSSLGLPRFDVSFDLELTPTLQALGLTAPYQPGGLTAVANDPRLIIDQAIHETHVAMDEDGTEAAAATVLLAYPVSAPAIEPVPVVLDRPFIYRIVDNTTGATLFIGQILDPTSS